MRLAPGQALFGDNGRVLHGRCAYCDVPGAPMRRLVRV